MQILRLGEPGAERPAVRADDGRVFDLSPLTSDIDGEFLARGGIGRVKSALAAGQLAPVSADGVRLGAPIARATARYLGSPAEAADVIAGYTIAHDVSEREFQLERGGHGTRASRVRRSTRSAMAGPGGRDHRCREA